MRSNDKKQLHTKTKEELSNMVKEARQDITQAIIGKSNSKVKNVHLIYQKKKSLAKILTVLQELRRING